MGGTVRIRGPVAQAHSNVDRPPDRLWRAEAFAEALSVDPGQDGHAERGRVYRGGRRAGAHESLTGMIPRAANIEGCKQCWSRAQEPRAFAGWELLSIRRA